MKVEKSTQERKVITTKSQYTTLEDDEWAIYTLDEIILSKIYNQLSLENNVDSINGTITYRDRKIPVLFVPYHIALFFKKNRDKYPDYVSFHRKKRSGVRGSTQEYGKWVAWKEGRSMPSIFLKKVFKNWKRF